MSETLTPAEPRRVWWARPRKLVALERPGGGGRSHRPERRRAEIAWLEASGVRLVVSTMTTRHNLAHYDAAGIESLHVPVPSCEEGAEALDLLVPVVSRATRRRGAVALHGNRRTDFVAALAAAVLHDRAGADPAASLAAAAAAGLDVTPASAALLGVDWPAVESFAA